MTFLKRTPATELQTLTWRRVIKHATFTTLQSYNYRA